MKLFVGDADHIFNFVDLSDWSAGNNYPVQQYVHPPNGYDFLQVSMIAISIF